MEHTRNLSAWLKSIGRGEVQTPPIAEEIQPVVLVEDAAHASARVDVPSYASWVQFAGWPGFHSGFILTAGPNGSWVDSIVEYLDNELLYAPSAKAEEFSMPTAFGLWVPPFYGSFSNVQPLSTIEYGLWNQGFSPFTVHQPAGRAKFADRQDPFVPFFLAPDRCLHVALNFHGDALFCVIRVRDIP